MCVKIPTGRWSETRASFAVIEDNCRRAAWGHSGPGLLSELPKSSPGRTSLVLEVFFLWLGLACALQDLGLDGLLYQRSTESFTFGRGFSGWGQGFSVFLMFDLL